MDDSVRPRLLYDAGTVLLDGPRPATLPPQFEWDARVEKYRAPALARRTIMQYFTPRAIEVEDASSRAKSLDLKLRTSYEPHPYQTEALRAWLDSGGCGSVVLPTRRGQNLRRPERHRPGRKKRPGGRAHD